jgi:hypothetical protein
MSHPVAAKQAGPIRAGMDYESFLTIDIEQRIFEGALCHFQNEDILSNAVANAAHIM